MRKSITRLEAEEYAQAGQHQNEALALLIKARSDMRNAFGRSPSAAAIQQFDREQMQLLRKPKDEEKKAELLAEKLDALAVEEQFVYETLGGVPCEQGTPTNVRAEQNTRSDQPTKSAGNEDASKPLDRGELEQRQHDVVLEAYEAQQMMAGLDGMTELARQRMAQGTQRAEGASSALARGETDEAKEAAREASGQFRELAKQVAALSAAELAAKIAATRDLTAELAERERELGDRFGAEETPGRSAGSDGHAGEAGPSGTEYDSLISDAAKIAESGQSVQDILEALGGDMQADGEHLARIASAREHAQMEDLVRRMQEIEQRLRSNKLDGIRAETREVADRLEVLAHELDAIHGSIVAPQLTQLLALEQQAAQLQERLAKLSSDAEITQWHLDTQTLMFSLENAGAGSSAVESLRQTMADAGWGSSRPGWGWELSSRDELNDVYYTAPPAYRDNLTGVIEVVQRKARELLLRDLMAIGQEAVPPQYEKLVERYFEVLSRERKPD